MNTPTQLTQPIATTLQQLQQVLVSLTDDQYGKPLAILNNSSIGQHVRHIIELFQALINGYDAGVVNYDKRERNPLLQNCCNAAREELTVIQEKIGKADKELLLAGNYSADQPGEACVKTCYHRELIYNLEHTTHHMAIIRIAVQESTALPVPVEFGVASATIRYQRSK